MVKGFDKFKQYFAPHSDSSIETNRDEWQSVLDSLNDPTGNMEDYLHAFSRHFGL